MRSNSILLCALLTPLLLATWSAPAQACKCKLSSVDEVEDHAQAIFFGELELYQEGSPDQWEASFRVIKPYKGVKDGEQLVVHNGPGSCAIPFRSGKNYMVFAKREGDRYTTDLCMMTDRADKAPIAPGLNSILPVAPGKGSPISRAARAQQVFTAQVTSLGSAYGGNWHNTAVEAKVKTSFKGKAKGKVSFRLDQRSCDGNKRVIVYNEDGSETPAPVKVGGTYLFFLHSDAPSFAMICHDNIQPLEDAGEAITALKGGCKKGVCGSDAYDKAHALRVGLEQQAMKLATNSILSCHQKHVTQGVISDISWDIALKDGDKLIVRNLQTSGTATAQSAYDGMTQCLIDTVSKSWELGPIDGEPVRMNMTFKLKEAKRAPIIEAKTWSLVRDGATR